MKFRLVSILHAILFSVSCVMILNNTTVPLCSYLVAATSMFMVVMGKRYFTAAHVLALAHIFAAKWGAPIGLQLGITILGTAFSILCLVFVKQTDSEAVPVNEGKGFWGEFFSHKSK